MFFYLPLLQPSIEAINILTAGWSINFLNVSYPPTFYAVIIRDFREGFFLSLELLG
ncbi:MAG: hypothetical protein F6K48_26925 [Okeania sp. SIO3H1]|nr:hypothetical protein [Okeania sp. SIO3H1]